MTEKLKRLSSGGDVRIHGTCDKSNKIQEKLAKRSKQKTLLTFIVSLLDKKRTFRE